MTVVKTKGVKSARHAAALRAYLDDERAVARVGHNLVDPARWEAEMRRTRRAFGKEGGQLMLHQVLAFNPDDTNRLTPASCVEFALSWLSERYPNNEAIVVLHEERGRDGVPRWAAHLGINCVDLESGKKLDEGHPRKAAQERAALCMRLDRERGLTVTEGRGSFSATHRRQPSRAVREIADGGRESWVLRLLTCARSAVAEAVGWADLAARLAAAGVRVRRDADGQAWWRDLSVDGARELYGGNLHSLGLDAESVEGRMRANTVRANAARRGLAVAMPPRRDQARARLFELSAAEEARRTTARKVERGSLSLADRIAAAKEENERLARMARRPRAKGWER